MQNDASSGVEKTRIQFLDSELDICQTFLNVAEIEADDPERQAQAERNALLSYGTALAWIGTVNSGEELDRLQTKLSRVKDRLERSSV
ncbi:MAG TPA: hypothetical protein VH325_13640 [Bryobacteraceae bacterium]|jgi:hypothetical protein|nr:hypothetical protein [Bryobacteraceae bacterium]